MELSGKLLSIMTVLDGRGTKIFEIEIGKQRYKFEKELPFYERGDLGKFQGKSIKIEGNLKEGSNQISDVTEAWVKIF